MAHKAGHGEGWQKRSKKHSSGGVYNKGKGGVNSCGKSKLRKSKCRKAGSNKSSFFQKVKDKIVNNKPKSKTGNKSEKSSKESSSPIKYTSRTKDSSWSDKI